MTSAQQEKTGLRGGDKQQGDLQNPARQPIDTPEGLKRERKGPVDKTAGRKGAEPSPLEGPAAYAPHEDGERAFPDRNPAKKKTGEF